MPVLPMVMAAGFVLLLIAIAHAWNKREQEEEKRQKEADSLSAMNNRNIVAGFIERGDFVHLSEEDFEAWLETNKGHVFPHEIEAMKRQHAAHRSAKQPHPRRN